MESLKFSVDLRSLDANGRPLGTERSSSSSGESGGARFAEDLETAASRAPGPTEQPAATDSESGPESAPTGLAAAETIAARPPVPEGPKAEGVDPRPVTATGEPEPTPAAPPAPVVPAPAPDPGAATLVVLAGAGRALPAPGLALGSPSPGAPAPGAAPTSDGPAGMQPSPEAPTMPPADGQLETAVGDDAGGGEKATGSALPSLHADEGPGSARPGVTHGHAATTRPEAALDRVPEAGERPPTHATRASDVERAEQVLHQLRLRISPGLRRATLALEPAHLGRIAIALHVRDGRLRAVLRAEKAETLGVLEAHVPELRAMLEQSGIEAKDIDLGLGAESDARGPDSDGKHGGGSKGGAPAHDPFGLEDDTAGERRLLRAVTDELGVDTYA